MYLYTYVPTWTILPVIINVPKYISVQKLRSCPPHVPKWSCTELALPRQTYRYTYLMKIEISTADTPRVRHASVSGVVFSFLTNRSVNISI